MPRARIYVDHETCACVFVNTHPRHVCLSICQHAHETHVPAYSSTPTRLVCVSRSTLCVCCITYVLQHVLYRTCCSRRASAPPSKPCVHGLICTERLRPLEHNQFVLFNLIRAYCAQIGVLWMELLRLRDGGKSVKLGVDVSLVLSDLVPTLRLKKRQCVRERAEQGGWHGFRDIEGWMGKGFRV